jgi:hypothetical protein
MRPLNPEPSGAASTPHGLPRSWPSAARNAVVALAYFALVVLLQRGADLVLGGVAQQPLVAMASTLVVAAALAPLLVLVRRVGRRPPARRQAETSGMAAAGALLGAVALAIPIYVVSAIVLRWGVMVVTYQAAQSSMVIVLATLIALACGAALFTVFRRALPAAGRR